MAADAVVQCPHCRREIQLVPDEKGAVPVCPMCDALRLWPKFKTEK